MTGWNLPPGCTDTDGPAGPSCSICCDQINEDKDNYVLVKGKFIHASCATVSQIVLAEFPSREDLAELAEDRELKLLQHTKIKTELRVLHDTMERMLAR